MSFVMSLPFYNLMDVVLSLEHFKILSLVFRVPPTDLVGLPVEYDQIAAQQVESGQILAGVLGIKDIIIDHVGRASGFLCVPPI